MAVLWSCTPPSSVLGGVHDVLTANVDVLGGAHVLLTAKHLLLGRALLLLTAKQPPSTIPVDHDPRPDVARA
jgi:hypothetical protein